ncbi:trigger factor [Methylocapsa sp. S129]|uniref:trigger factor n=1 Tax=Methylocapsa sp. S129 TaxID=1641869 RepID=UPI00131A7E0A|nr:trigger factor [Methylocapsa sp. S129]
MQVTETLSQGLKREYSINLSATDLAARLDGQLADMKNKIKINGFRPGKVPVAHLKRVYGRSVMADVVQEAITEANKQIVDDNGLRLAQEPKVELPTDQASIEAALEARGDLNFTVALEVLPKFDVGAFDDVSLERPVVEVQESDVDQALERFADNRRTYADRPEGAKAENGDRVTVDFVGTIAGEAFEGGTSENIEVILGSNTFIPGFEEQLVGVAAGERRAVEATFPEAYVNRALAGQKAAFDVTVKAIAAPEAFTIDDEFAKSLNFESLDKLKEMIRENISNEYSKASREKLKRQLLDNLDNRYSFELPEGLVSQEFDSIWRQVEQEQKASGRGFADENTTEEAARADYRRIAERRVRLGLLLAEVGSKAEVKVTDEEVTSALIARARAYPGQEKQIWDYYRKNAQALAELRAPIYEEKVVDHILTLAKVGERKMTREELMKADDDETLPAK